MPRGARWTEEQYNRDYLGKKKRNKLNAQRAESGLFQELAGRSFASKLERDRAQELVVMQRAREIKDLSFQPVVLLTRAECSYKPDFYYKELRYGSWIEIWEEAKGKEMYPFFTNRKLWTVYGPGILRITKRGTGGRIIITQEIMPNG